MRTAQVYAQTADENNEQLAIEPPKITTLPPAYESQMLRLSEVLGSLHYLRELCGAKKVQNGAKQWLM